MQKLKILVVEDDTSFSAMLVMFLSENGFEPIAAVTGRDAFKKAVSCLPDLMLLDYHLPDMTGYDVAMALKWQRNTSKIPLILLSSLGADPLLVSSFKKLPVCKGVFVKTEPLSIILDAILSTLASENENQSF